jgi:hypothetical protein
MTGMNPAQDPTEDAAASRSRRHASLSIYGGNLNKLRGGLLMVRLPSHRKIGEQSLMQHVLGNMTVPLVSGMGTVAASQGRPDRT